MVRGGCNCGDVTYEIDAEVSDVYVCHCSICRRSTGSQGIAVVVVGKDVFRWVSGEAHIATWQKPNSDWQTWFCARCGSTLPGVNDPERMYVPAGSITEGGGGLQVKHHIWTGSKAVWDEIGDAGRQHPGAFEP